MQVSSAGRQTKKNHFDMSEIMNQSPDQAKNGSGPENGQSRAGILSAGNAEASASGTHQESKLKKAWTTLVAFVNYLDEEVPDAPQDEASASKLKRCWMRFNAFLDSLEQEDEPVPESGLTEGKQSKCKACFSWFQSAAFDIVVIVFLFIATMAVTTWTLSFIEEQRGRFYPDADVVKCLAAEHETLEAAASELAASGKKADIPIDSFDRKFVEMLKPVRIYSDEYGVYIVTRSNWYAGEHGVFIANDNNNMPPKLNWGVIEGRVFAYGLFD